MSLFDIIYDFFINFVFHSEADYGSDIWVNGEVSLFGASTSLGEYFSLIASIITIVALVIVCIIIIKKIFSICFNLFTGRSIF